jgi:two-component system sensor histidine kinase/response regulator
VKIFPLGREGLPLQALMKILIIDDEEPVRQTLATLLELNGFAVVTAADGAEGVRLAASEPDIILCDVSMPPGINGFAVLEAVRQQPKGALIPFLFLTGNIERSDQRRGMALGADDYITKPFTEKEIVDAIKARVRRQRPLQERVNTLVEQHRRQAGADWSHELLTPLNGMLGGLQLLELEVDTISREELKEMIGFIRGGVERQEKLSRKLIRYFELERLNDRVRPVGGYRCQADEAIKAGLRRAHAEYKREQDMDVRCSAGAVALPEAFLADAVAELAANALRFSTPGQRVTLSAEAVGSQYRIEVTDQGPGMTAEERAKVAPFTQFGRAKREQQGLGLGLAIARLVAQVGGGTLQLDAGPGGRGVKVTMLLPLA